MKEVIASLELAIANKGHIHSIVGASYPNGMESHGTNRDIALNLNAEQSAKVYVFIKDLLTDSAPFDIDERRV